MPTSLPQRLRSFFAELKRRRVVRVAMVYGIVGVAAIEAADAVIPALQLPDTLVTVVAVLVLVGFPIAVGLAWAFDIGDEGLVRSPSREAAASSPAAAGPILSRRSWAVIVPALSVLLVLVIWKPFDIPFSVANDPGAEYIDSVAIMPIDNMTGLGRMDAFGIGLAEDIIAQLQRIAPLKTTSFQSARSAAEQGLAIDDIARLLGVQHIVRGELDTTGTGLAIILRQIDMATGAEIWRKQYEASLAEPDAARDTIAWDATRSILDAMPLLPRPEEFRDVRHGPGQNEYQLGKLWLGRRTPEGMRRAISNFIQSIMLDDTNAQAYADLSSAYALALTYRYDIGIDSWAAAGKALTLADRALQLDPDAVGGYASRGYLGALVNAPVQSVNGDFRQAIARQPNAASVASWSARALEMAGQPVQALARAEKAVQVDPLAAGRLIAVAYLSLQIGGYDQAIEYARRAQQIEPELMLSRAIEGRALLLAGRAAECLELDLGPHEVLRATCLWEMGQTAEADRIVRRVEQLTDQHRSVQPEFTPVLQAEDLAVHYAWIGDSAAALHWIEVAYALSPTGLEVRVYKSALFDRVRDPAFVSAVETLRAGLYPKVLRGTL